MPVTPTLAELIRRALEARLEDVWSAAPGKVLRYDAAKQAADVEVGYRRSVPDDSGAPVVEDPVVVADVPVAFPAGGNFFVSFPLAAGDPVLLVFCDRGLDRWRAVGTAEEPGDGRALGPAGAVAVPCAPRPDSKLIAGAHATYMVAGRDGDVRTAWTGTEVRLTGPSDVQFVARADRVLTELSAIITGFNAHVHPGVTAGGASTAAPTPLAGAASVAADKARVT